MGSINAQQTAYKVLDTIREGKKVKLGEIIKSQGYSPITATVPTMVTNTKTYQMIMERSRKPLLERLTQQINSVEYELSRKKLSNEDYRTLVGSLDIYIKNYQLLSGGATERNILVLPSEVMLKNSIQQTQDNTPIDNK